MVEGAWDISVDSLQELLDYEGFTKIVGDLKKDGRTIRGPLEIRLQKRKAVTMSAHSSDPKQLAAENKAYPLRFASQYARNCPFVLLFVIHPWLQGELHQNFAGFVDTFGSEFAKLVFHGFSSDNSDTYGIPTSEAVKLLSGFVLLNVWPEAKSAGKGPSSRIYLNPAATIRWATQISPQSKLRRAQP